MVITNSRAVPTGARNALQCVKCDLLELLNLTSVLKPHFIAPRTAETLVYPTAASEIKKPSGVEVDRLVSMLPLHDFGRSGVNND